jgi:N6-adenosine-specific RNA methylase IME4
VKDIITIDNYCQLSKTELKFKREVTKEEWAMVFNALKGVEGCVQFWIGDCLAYRQQKWGMYDDIAEETGYDKGTLKNIKAVSDNVESSRRRDNLGFSHHVEVAPLPPEKQELFLNKAVEENLSVRELREEIKKDKRQDLKPSMIPDGEFNVIYADPPWQYSNSGFEMSAENKYPTMSIDDMIDQVQFKTSENAVLFLWVTNPLLLESFELISAWGFEYKTNFVWIKDRHTAGFYVFGQHELLLICVKGSGMLPEEKHKSIINGLNDVHSKKPHLVYDVIESMYPNHKYLELFARNKREGWKSYGNEL